MKTATMTRYPDFIYIGAGKCGSTSLFNYIGQHPDVFLCPKKETFYFINEQARSNLVPWGAITKLEDYLDLFEKAPEGCVTGEISTNYYAYPESAELIKASIPDVKLIALLRNPAERAFSEYQMHARNGHEKRPFSDILEAHEKYVKRGFYYAELKPFFDVFDHQNIRVLLYDDFVQNPQDLIRQIFAFIGVEESFVPDMSVRGREGGLPKNQALHQLLNKKNILRSVASKILKLVLPLSKRQEIRSKMIKGNMQKQTLSSQDRQALIQIYREDILSLQSMLGRDLSFWLT